MVLRVSQTGLSTCRTHGNMWPLLELPRTFWNFPEPLSYFPSTLGATPSLSAPWASQDGALGQSTSARMLQRPSWQQRHAWRAIHTGGKFSSRDFRLFEESITVLPAVEVLSWQ